MLLAKIQNIKFIADCKNHYDDQDWKIFGRIARPKFSILKHSKIMPFLIIYFNSIKIILLKSRLFTLML